MAEAIQWDLQLSRQDALATYDIGVQYLEQ